MRPIAALAAALALITAACTSGDDDLAVTTTTAATAPPTTSTTEPVQPKPSGGTIRTVYGPAGPQTVNPLFSVLEADAGGGLALGWYGVLDGNVNVGVWRFDGTTGELVPDLITEAPSFANGGLTENENGTLTVRYEIDPDAVWSDGEPITGADFAFTHDAIVSLSERFRDGPDPELPTVTSCNEDSPIVFRPFLVDSHERVVPGSLSFGDKTVEFTLDGPDAYTERLFPYVLPEHAVAGTDIAADWLYRLWPSAGPFVLESFDREDQLVTLSRNPNYWRTDPDTGQSLPLVDRVVLGRLPEFSERLPDSIEFDHDGDAATAPITVDRLREYDAVNRICQPDEAVRRLGIEEGTQEAEIIGAAWARAFDQVQIELFSEGAIVAVTQASLLPGLREDGFDVRAASQSIWEHIAFNYGDARLRANPDSLVEHLEFRHAIAHALDRDRIAAEVAGTPARRIDGIVEAFSPALRAPEGAVRQYDPFEARRLLDDLCNRIGRDCAADPPSVTFTYDARRETRSQLAGLVGEMLGEVGIDVDFTVQNLFVTAGTHGRCEGWEMSTWAWSSQTGLNTLAGVYSVIDPRLPAMAGPDDDTNVYAWGTDAATGLPDDPQTEDCDESTVWNQGPSSVRNEFTERFGELLGQLERTIDREQQLLIIQELETILAERTVLIPLYLRPTGYAVRSDIVGGVGFEVASGLQPIFWNLEQWYLEQPQPGT